MLHFQQSIKNVLRDGLIYFVYRGVVISVDPNAKITNKLAYTSEAIFDRTGNVFKVRNQNIESFIRKFILSDREAVFTIRNQEEYNAVIDTINESMKQLNQLTLFESHLIRYHMMNKVQHMLLKLSEECNEVGQAASKCIQFGLDDSYNDVTNRERLINEIKDLVSVIHILNEDFGLGYEFDSVHLEEKRNKINKYLQLSIDNGHVKDN